MKKLFLPIFILTFVIYKLFGPVGNTPYNYFTRLSAAFLNGQFWIAENPPWLSELVPGGSNKFYIVYPPMPAIASLPFVAIFGKDFPQQILAHLMGAGIVLLTVKLALRIKSNYKVAFWSGTLVGLGSVVWFLSSVGSSWYLGQISAMFFMLFALLEVAGKKRGLIIGTFLGASYLSRIHTVLALPLFIYLIAKDRKSSFLKDVFQIVVGFLPFLMFNSLYNYARFGVIWDKGYLLIPKIFEEPWYQNGLFHPSYIGRHLEVIFKGLPVIKNTFPYIQPSWSGMAIWITTPAFIYSIKTIRQKWAVPFWLTILAIASVVFMHGTTGFAQFGYRFAVDFYPFLIFLIIKNVTKTDLKWHHWLLLFISVGVNFWGVLWINKFGWVSY